MAPGSKSIAFFTAMGYSFNPQFTDETATCMIISEDIYAMLLTHAKFKEFTPKEICDTKKATEALISLSCESRNQVDELVAKAVAAGGTLPEPAQDCGFMYASSYEDLDGHGWNLIWMDPSFVPPT